jgi:hypothetical protein
VGDDASIDNEALLMTNFVNLKIKSAQSFEGVYRDRMYVYIHKDECSELYEYLCLYYIKKKGK